MRLGKIINFFITIVFIVAIILIFSLTLQKIIFKDDVPSILGYKILQVMSGSMSGEFETEDTIIIRQIKNESEIKIGDIITFKVDENTLVTHRVVEIVKNENDTEYVTKGDANNSVDTQKVKFKDIEGKYLFKTIILGKIIKIIQSPIGINFVLILPVLIIAIIVINDKDKENKKNMRKEKRLKYELEKTKEGMKQWRKVVQKY